MNGLPPQLTLAALRSRSRQLPSGCLVWLGQRIFGYGYVGGGRSGRYLRVHRVAWMLHQRRQIPHGKQVRHTCDNRACWARAHLRLGTHIERYPYGDPRGTISPPRSCFECEEAAWLKQKREAAAQKGLDEDSDCARL